MKQSSQMELGLKDKVYLVTAASQGLGFGIAEALAAEGAKVFISSSNEKKIETACQKLKRSYPNTKIAALKADLKISSDLEKLIATCLYKFKTIDGLVLNSGSPPAGFFEDFNDKDWHEAIDMNLMSVIRMIRNVLPIMEDNQKGNILLLSSSSVKEPIENLILSNVVRSGAVALVKSLSARLIKNNIRINNLIPGRIHTDRIDSLDEIMSKTNNISIEKQRKLSQSIIPAGRYGKISEFANAATFLCSQGASYITGTNLIVDGGLIRSVY